MMVDLTGRVREFLGQEVLSHSMRLIDRTRRTLELAKDYVNQRPTFGDRLADLQQIHAMVADSHIDLHGSHLMTMDCTARMDDRESVKTHPTMTKLFVSEALYLVTVLAAQMRGELGTSENAPVSLIRNELRPFGIYDGASDLDRATLGRRFLKAAESNPA